MHDMVMAAPAPALAVAPTGTHDVQLYDVEHNWPSWDTNGLLRPPRTHFFPSKPLFSLIHTQLPRFVKTIVCVSSLQLARPVARKFSQFILGADTRVLGCSCAICARCRRRRRIIKFVFVSEHILHQISYRTKQRCLQLHWRRSFALLLKSVSADSETTQSKGSRVLADALGLNVYRSEIPVSVLEH